MKTLNIFLIFCFLSCSGLAQTPKKSNSNAFDRNKSVSIGSRDTTPGRGITRPYQLTGKAPGWIDITGKKSSSGINSYIPDEPILYNRIGIDLPKRSAAYMANPVSGGNFNSKWERLTGKPIVDTISVYYYPIKRITPSTLSDNHLYRLSANIFNAIMDVNYPTRNSPK